jgi:O-antigen/teichoic acid export membrane protein
VQASSRVFVNTGALYIKLIITTIINLYLMRVVLSVLGIDDFGIYTLIAGVINLLAFLNGSLMFATQRYLSVAIGQDDFKYLKRIFSISLKLHLCLALFIFVLLEILASILFDDFFSISSNRLPAAKVVYQLMTASVVCTIVSAPYNAELNAHEHLWFFAIVETVCAIVKLGIIFVLSKALDALILYTAWMLMITVLNFIIKFVWCHLKYKEVNNNQGVKIKDNVPLIREMSRYIGWSSLSSFAIIGRDQGTAVIINVFFSTTINGVVGIANQVRGLLLYFSTMVTTSITPQIMKSKGEKNKEKMLNLSIFTCKLSFALSAILSIPILLNLPFILNIWLEEVPQYAVIYCKLIIFAFMISQLYPGINRVIMAEGNIKYYQITISILLLMPLFISSILFYRGFIHYMMYYLVIIAEIFSMVASAIFAYNLLRLDLKKYMLFIFLSILIFSSVYMYGEGIQNIISNQILSFILSSVIPTLMFIGLYYFIIFDKKERIAFKNLINRIKIK